MLFFLAIVEYHGTHKNDEAKSQRCIMDETARKRLKEARVNAGLSLRDLAAQTDISPSQLSQIERGKSEPSVSSLFKLVAALGISLAEVMGGEANEGTVKTGEVVATAHRQGAQLCDFPL